MRTGNRKDTNLIIESLRTDVQIDEAADKYLYIEDTKSPKVKNFFIVDDLAGDFHDFLKRWDKTRADYYKKNLSNLEFKPLRFSVGKNYIKVVDEHSVRCFIDKYGNIYKAASWQAPAQGVRFYLDSLDDIDFDAYTGFLYGNRNLSPRDASFFGK